MGIALACCYRPMTIIFGFYRDCQGPKVRPRLVHEEEVGVGVGRPAHCRFIPPPGQGKCGLKKRKLGNEAGLPRRPIVMGCRGRSSSGVNDDPGWQC